MRFAPCRSNGPYGRKGPIRLELSAYGRVILVNVRVRVRRHSPSSSGLPTGRIDNSPGAGMKKLNLGEVHGAGLFGRFLSRPTRSIIHAGWSDATGLVIWEHKLTLHVTALAQGDGPIGKFSGRATCSTRPAGGPRP